MIIDQLSILLFTSRLVLGLPLDNTTLYLLDENLKLVKRGDMGELYVAGFNLATGYVARRDADRFIKNPYSNESGTWGVF